MKISPNRKKRNNLHIKQIKLSNEIIEMQITMKLFLVSFFGYLALLLSLYFVAIWMENDPFDL